MRRFRIDAQTLKGACPFCKSPLLPYIRGGEICGEWQDIDIAFGAAPPPYAAHSACINARQRHLRTLEEGRVWLFGYPLSIGNLDAASRFSGDPVVLDKSRYRILDAFHAECVLFNSHMPASRLLIGKEITHPLLSVPCAWTFDSAGYKAALGELVGEGEGGEEPGAASDGPVHATRVAINAWRMFVVVRVSGSMFEQGIRDRLTAIESLRRRVIGECATFASVAIHPPSSSSSTTATARPRPASDAVGVYFSAIDLRPQAGQSVDQLAAAVVAAVCDAARMKDRPALSVWYKRRVNLIAPSGPNETRMGVDIVQDKDGSHPTPVALVDPLETSPLRVPRALATLVPLQDSVYPLLLPIAMPPDLSVASSSSASSYASRLSGKKVEELWLRSVVINPNVN